MAAMPASLLRAFARWLSQAEPRDMAPVIEVLAVRMASRAVSAEILLRRAAAAARQEGM